MPINYCRLKYSIPIMVDELLTSGSTKQNIQLLILQDRLPLKSQTAAYPIAKNDMPISIMIAAIILFFASASFKRLVPKNTPKTMLSSRAGAT